MSTPPRSPTLPSCSAVQQKLTVIGISNNTTPDPQSKHKPYIFAIQKRTEPALAYTVFDDPQPMSSVLQTSRELYQTRYLTSTLDRFFSRFTRVEIGTARILRKAQLQRTFIDLSMTTVNVELADYMVDTILTDAYYRRVELHFNIRTMLEDPFFGISHVGTTRDGQQVAPSRVLVLRIVPNKVLLLWSFLALVNSFLLVGLVVGLSSKQVDVGVGIAGGGFAMVAVFHALVVWVNS